MRAIGQSDGVSVKAYAGTTGVILAFDVAARRARGPARLRDPALGRQPARPLARRRADLPRRRAPAGRVPGEQRGPDPEVPLVGLRGLPGHDVHLRRAPGLRRARQARARPGPSVTVMTSSVTRGDHRVVFNRAAAASQAFSREFPEVQAAIDAARKAKHRAPPLPANARAWLTRGALEQITSFMRSRAGPDVGAGHRDLRVRAAGDPRRDRRRAPPRRGRADRLPRQARRPADRGQRGEPRGLAGDPEARARHEPHLPRQVRRAEPHLQRAAHADRGAVRLDELHRERRLPPGERRPHRRPPGARRDLPARSSRSCSAAPTRARRRSGSTSTTRCPRTRRSSRASRRAAAGRPRSLRRRDPRGRARRAVLHGVRSQPEGARRADGRAATTRSCATACRTRPTRSPARTAIARRTSSRPRC